MIKKKKGDKKRIERGVVESLSLSKKKKEREREGERERETERGRREGGDEVQLRR